jgi:hypothetical protein
MDSEAMMAEQDEEWGKNVEQFIVGVRDDIPEAAFNAFQVLAYQPNGLRAALRQVVRGLEASERLRGGFLLSWVTREQIRRDVNDDDLLLDALPHLLPHYKGPGRRLFRGESELAHGRGTLGWSWTTSPEVARQYAGFFARTEPRGGLLLAADAPAAAIFCAPAEHSHLRQEEQEYMVDRRVLAGLGVEIEVVETLPHVPPTA